MRVRIERSRPRGAYAATELALVLPFLAFILMAGVDFARLFCTYLTITSCARSGALYGSQSLLPDPNNPGSFVLDTTGIKSAAVADGSSLQPALTASNVSTSTTPASGTPQTLQVTVTYGFYPIIKFPVFARLVFTYGTDTNGNPYFPLSRTVTMTVAPDAPN
jgi:Flp pilus assembly protein TadG